MPFDVNPMGKVVVVGASLGGYRTALALRKARFQGPITLIGSEKDRPYQRPPLSKGVLTGKMPKERVFLRGEVSPPLESHLDTVATRLDTQGRVVVGANGCEFPYDVAVLATGATPRRLANLPDSPLVVYLRTLSDAIEISNHFKKIRSLAVIGAGFIGAEVASSARACGIEVHLIDIDPRPMSRALGAAGSALIRSLHESNGVIFHLENSVDSVEEVTGLGLRLSLRDGQSLEVDLVVVGVGVVPNVAWLEGSGVGLQNGVIATSYGAVQGFDNVFAVGDVSAWFHPLYQRHLRFEHFESTVLQARIVAENIATGSGNELAEVPFAWSDQYDAVIQFLGVTPAQAQETIFYGDPSKPDEGVVLGYESERGVEAALLFRASEKLNELKELIEHTLKRA